MSTFTLGVYTKTIFTRQVTLSGPSPFIRAMHPKSEIRPDPDVIRRILSTGWIGQLKIHGHRAQIHVSSDERVIAFTRLGKLHSKELPAPMLSEIRRLFRPQRGWNAVDSEWLKAEDKLFVFDFLKKEGASLRHLTYPERWKLLPRAYLSPNVFTLPMIRDLKGCLAVIGNPPAHIEGLVFKSSTTTGFSDTSIVRCRVRRTLS
jgi:ATP-dependent DNA ligase